MMPFKHVFMTQVCLCVRLLSCGVPEEFWMDACMLFRMTVLSVPEQITLLNISVDRNFIFGIRYN